MWSLLIIHSELASPLFTIKLPPGPSHIMDRGTEAAGFDVLGRLLLVPSELGTPAPPGAWR